MILKDALKLESTVGCMYKGKDSICFDGSRTEDYIVIYDHTNLTASAYILLPKDEVRKLRNYLTSYLRKKS